MEKYKFCCCGCGEMIPLLNKHGKEIKCIAGHYVRFLNKTVHKGKKLSKEHKDKISKAHKGRKKNYPPTKYWLGKKFSKEMREKIAKAGRRRKQSIETRIKQSLAHKGNKSYLWQGGKTKQTEAIRCSLEYRLWREKVFKRDNYTCIWCGQIGGTLNADHIKPFALFPKLRFDLNNGRTLCLDCHKKTPSHALNHTNTSFYKYETT